MRLQDAFNLSCCKAQGGNIVSENDNRKGGGMFSLPA